MFREVGGCVQLLFAPCPNWQVATDGNSRPDPTSSIQCGTSRSQVLLPHKCCAQNIQAQSRSERPDSPERVSAGLGPAAGDVAQKGVVVRSLLQTLVPAGWSCSPAEDAV